MVTNHASECGQSPLPTEPRQAGLAGEELLHRGLFDVALLGDQPLQPGDQGIDVGEGGGNGALFSLFIWKRDLKRSIIAADV